MPEADDWAAREAIDTNIDAAYGAVKGDEARAFLDDFEWSHFALQRFLKPAPQGVR
jgi:hypothetical protein